jgi:alpha-glucoside transport system substrate-binding protein
MRRTRSWLAPWLLVLATAAPHRTWGAGEQPADEIGGSVSVLAVWGAEELDVFRKMVAPFEAQTGIRVEYEGTRDLDAILTTRVSAGNPPDLAGLPNPGKMAELARQGKLVDLAGVLDMDQFRRAYGPVWIELGSVDGKLSGIFAKASLKGLVWYDPKRLRSVGVAVPTTFQQLLDASRAIAAKGTTPWAIGVESGAASGWVGTDWIEALFLCTQGPERYRQWVQGKVAWTAPEMKQAWQRWAELAADPKMVFGGPPYVLATNFGQAFLPVFQDPPKAYFHLQGAFIQTFIRKQLPTLQPGSDYDFFPLPPASPRFAQASEIAGDLFGMLRRTPQSVALMRYLASAQAQRFWVQAANGISPNRQVPLSDYPDPLSRRAAQILTSSQAAVFDASDMMPSRMSAAFSSAILNALANPGQLDQVLGELEKVRAEVYPQVKTSGAGSAGTGAGR